MQAQLMRQRHKRQQIRLASYIKQVVILTLYSCDELSAMGDGYQPQRGRNLIELTGSIRQLAKELASDPNLKKVARNILTGAVEIDRWGCAGQSLPPALRLLAELIAWR